MKRQLLDFPLKQHHFGFLRVFPKLAIQIFTARRQTASRIKPAWIADRIEIQLVTLSERGIPHQLSCDLNQRMRPGLLIPMNPREERDANRITTTMRTLENESLQAQRIFRIRQRSADQKIRSKCDRFQARDESRAPFTPCARTIRISCW